jgi:hypothetical protein
MTTVVAAIDELAVADCVMVADAVFDRYGDSVRDASAGRPE